MNKRTQNRLAQKLQQASLKVLAYTSQGVPEELEIDGWYADATEATSELLQCIVATRETILRELQDEINKAQPKAPIKQEKWDSGLKE